MIVEKYMIIFAWTLQTCR